MEKNIFDNVLRAVRNTNKVSKFCWNRIDSSNYKEIAREIHGTDMWTYKYAEVINQRPQIAWGACLLNELPEQQAAELMIYCVMCYEG